MADGKREYQAMFTIGATLLGSFKGAMMQAKSRLMELARTAKTLGGVMKGIGIAGITALASIAGTILGVVAKNVWDIWKRIWDDAVSNAEQAADRMRVLTSYLKMDNDFRKKGNEFIQSQIDLLDKHNEKLAAQTGMSQDIYDQSNKTLVKYGAMPHTLAQMAGPMGDFLAATKGPRATMGDMAVLSDQVGTAIEGGPILQLRRMGLLTEGVRKDWSKMTKQARLKEVMKALKKFDGEAKKAMDTPIGRVVKFHNAMDKLSSTIGETLLPVLGDMADMWRAVVETPAFQTSMITAAKAFATIQKNIAEYVLTKVIPAFNELAANPVWSQMRQVAGEFFSWLGDQIIQFGKDWAEMWANTVTELKWILIGLSAIDKKFLPALEKVVQMEQEIEMSRLGMQKGIPKNFPPTALIEPATSYKPDVSMAGITQGLPKQLTGEMKTYAELQKEIIDDKARLGPAVDSREWWKVGSDYIAQDVDALMDAQRATGAFIEKRADKGAFAWLDEGVQATIKLGESIRTKIADAFKGVNTEAANTNTEVGTSLSGVDQTITTQITVPLENATQAFNNLKASMAQGVTIPTIAGPAASLPNPAPADANPIPHQMGGIITKPTVAMVGERGPEAVIPLAHHQSRAAKLLEYAKNVWGATSFQTPTREDIASMPMPYAKGAFGGPMGGGTEALLKGVLKMVSPAAAPTSVNFAPVVNVQGNATPEDQRAMDTKLRDLARDFIEQFKQAQYQERRLSYESGYG